MGEDKTILKPPSTSQAETIFNLIVADKAASKSLAINGELNNDYLRLVARFSFRAQEIFYDEYLQLFQNWPRPKPPA